MGQDEVREVLRRLGWATQARIAVETGYTSSQVSRYLKYLRLKKEIGLDKTKRGFIYFLGTEYEGKIRLDGIEEEMATIP